jgi:hypothetical protein
LDDRTATLLIDANIQAGDLVLVSGSLTAHMPSVAAADVGRLPRTAGHAKLASVPEVLDRLRIEKGGPIRIGAQSARA